MSDNTPDKQPKQDWEMTLREKYDPEGKLPKRTLDDVLDELFKEKGISPYVVIDADVGGQILPGDVPEFSGKVAAQNGKVYRYWLWWDHTNRAPNGNKGYYELGEHLINPITGETGFREVPPEEFQRLYKRPLAQDKGYIRARKQLGLPLTEEQERILKEREL